MPRMRSTANLALLLVLSSLTGCVLAPGQYVKPDGWFSSQSEPEVEVIPITPKLFVTEQAVVAVTDALPEELLTYKQDVYIIGPGDTLYVTVWDHPELTVPAGTQLNNNDANGRLVRPDGTLYYPYIGAVQAQGKTLDMLRADMAQRLAKYVESPQVDVAVLRYGSQRVFLTGAFKSAAPLAITTVPLTLAEALSNINTQEADLTALELIRDGVSYRLNYDRLTRKGVSLGGVVLKANDTLFMPFNDRRKVYVMGEVASQRALPFKTDGISLAEALTSVGGLRQETAKARSVYVIRGIDRDGAGPETTVYQLNANSVISLSLADRFQLRAGDMVYVGPAQVTRWNRFISSLLPSASLLTAASDIRDNSNN